MFMYHEFPGDNEMKNLLVYTVVVVLLLNLSVFTYPQASFAEENLGTVVSGSITEDTIWKEESSPYRIQGGLSINPNTTLTIEPGVEVIGSAGVMVSVKGSLKARGSKQQRISFKDVYINGFSFLNSSIILENTNHLREKINGGFLVTVSSETALTLNSNHFRHGMISISPPKNNITISKNLFEDRAALSLSNGSGRVWITGNTFDNEEADLTDLDIYSSDPDGKAANVQINENNFFGWEHLKIRLRANKDLTFDANNNYWGTIDKEKINRLTVDDTDYDRNTGKIDNSIIAYKPFNNGWGYGILDAPGVNNVGEIDTAITGATDADTYIQIWKAESMIGEGYSLSTGQFKVNIAAQQPGTILTIRAKDSFNRESLPRTVMVKDVVAPLAPEVEEVSNLTTLITGTSEPSSKVIARSDERFLGTAVANDEGMFMLAIETLAENTFLYFYAEDEEGNQSETINIKVTDRTAPVLTVAPIELTNAEETLVSGVTEPGMLVKALSNEVLIASTYSSRIDGSFQLKLPTQKAGSIVEVLSEDPSGNTSLPVEISVKDATPPTLMLSFAFPVNDRSGEVLGSSEEGLVVTVSKNGSVLGSGRVVNGKFAVQIPKQQAGEILQISTADEAGNETILEVTVLDGTSPVITKINSLTDAMNELSGITEAGAAIHVYSGGILLGSGTADQQGGFRVVIPRQPANTFVNITATDKACNTSEQYTMKVKDGTPPQVPTVKEVSNKSTFVLGTSEPYSTVIVTALGKTYTGIADFNGSYKIAIPVLNYETSLSVKAQDSGGNVSSGRTMKVTKAAPNMPSVNSVTNKSTLVTGETDKYAFVSVKAGSRYYSAKADGNGNYKVGIAVQNSGTVLAISAKDSLGRISASRSSVVTKAAPNIPVVNTVNNKATNVTGKSERYTSVLVRASTKTYTGKADGNGNFKVVIPVQNHGGTISVTAKDSNGRESAAKTVPVTRVGPNIPVVSSVRSYSTSVSGKAEKYTAVTVKIGSRNFYGKTNGYGNFKVSIPKQKRGTKIYVTVKDKQGKVSVAKVVTVN